MPALASRTNGTSSETTKLARRAGLFYAAIILLGLGGEAGLRLPLIDWSDGASTAAAMEAAPWRLRASILTDLSMAGLDIALAIAFFVLLRPFAPIAALAAMVFRLMQAAIIAGGILMLHAADTAAFAGGNPLPLLALHAAGYDLGLAFFAVNSGLMAWLLARAGAPRPIAWGIAGSALVYAVGSITRFVAPELNAAMQPAYGLPVLAESALAVWLLLGAPGGFQPRSAASSAAMS